MPVVREQVAVLDKAVAKSGYLVGDRLTFADINLMPILHRMQQAPGGAAMVAEARHLASYYARHAARRSFQRTDPPPGPPGREQVG
jgi:glutathione S-transferase